MAFEEDLRTHLLAQGVGASTSVFIGNRRREGNGIPHRAIFVTLVGGAAPNEFLGNGAFGTYKRPTLQVRVRGDVGDFATGRDLANSAWDACQAPALSGTLAAYVRVVNIQSAPAFMGLDDTEHPEWVFSVRMEKKE